MNAFSNNSIATFVIGFALLTGAGAASAEEPGKRVDFADLNPAQSADVAVMYERITTAAKMVCREASSPWDGRQQRNYKVCVQGAIDQAVMDINLTALTDLHHGNADKIASR